MARTQDELIQALEEQLGFLKKSGAEFDAGDLTEAKRLANAVVVLVEDGKRKKFKSILTQLGVRDELQFLSSGGVDPSNLLADMPLVAMRLSVGPRGGSAKYIPMFGETHAPKKLSFEQWWSEPIFKEQGIDALTLDRQTLTRALRDQEGGSHFDDELSNPVYIGIAKEHSDEWLLVTEQGSAQIEPGPHLASMRQIAWELEHTIASLPDELRKQTQRP